MNPHFAGTPANKDGMAGGIPQECPGRPEEVAEAILFIASTRASFITEASLLVDGGKSAQDSAGMRK